jgi:8-oxo-(d)GTP phosphatase
MPSNKPGSRLIQAAGAVAWRPGPDGEPEILLVHRKKYDDWSLPKGKAEPDEPLPVTAVREVLEEGGARLALGRRLVSVRYNMGGRPKRVHYWAARVLSVDARAVPNSEVDKVSWVPAVRAVEKVSYSHDLGVLTDFAGRPVRTVPLILLRHSKALSKDGWKRPDAARPLDDSGRSDAKALADLLTCFAPRPRLISSTAVRCADTLRPLSQLTGEPVQAKPSLFIHSQSSLTGEADSGSGITALVREVIASGEPTVICAHRENLPVLQEAALTVLAGHAGGGTGSGSAAGVPGDAAARLPREWGETLPTSGFWVLNVAPLPPGPDPASGPGPAPVPEPGGPVPEQERGVEQSARHSAGLAPRRRWWQFRRARVSQVAAAQSAEAVAPGKVPAGDVTSGDVTSGDAAGSGAPPGKPASAGPGGATASALAGGDATGSPRPAGVLISADRYDLAGD